MTAPIPNPAQAGAAAGDMLGRIIVTPSIIPGVGELAGLADTVTAARRWVSDRHNWVRVSWVGLGVFLVAAGVIWMARKPIEQMVQEKAGAAAAVGTTVATKGAV